MNTTVNINKVFVVNLDDKIHRWNHFEKLGKKVERVPAVDSRKNWFVYEEFGLNLTPYGKSNDHYFTQSKGAVGCYLSHYKIWKSIIKNKIEWSLVLEDDAHIESVKEYLSDDFRVKVEDGVDVIQLNDRTQHLDIIEHFNGTTSYLINLRGAEILYNATHDFSYFPETPDDILQWRIDQLNLHECPHLLRDKTYTDSAWKTKNSIRLAVDKFIGYNGHKCIPKNKRLSLKFDPKIKIHESDIVSDVTDPGDIYYWDMSCDELADLEKRPDFKWWTRP